MTKEELLKESESIRALKAWTQFLIEHDNTKKAFELLTEDAQEQEADGYDIMLSEVRWHDMAIGFFLGKGFSIKEACILGLHAYYGDS